MLRTGSRPHVYSQDQREGRLSHASSPLLEARLLRETPTDRTVGDQGVRLASCRAANPSL